MTSPVTFSEPLAYGENYPVPAFPVLPRTPGSSTPCHRHIPANVGVTLLTTRARYGLAMIAKAELRERDLVLLPAYHCPSLVEPFIWAGCKIHFYAMNADLSPKLPGFDESLKAARAIVLVRYFGFDGNIARFAGLAREQNCLVIEDLAHAPYINELHGDYGVTSLVKFYPVTTGAEIWIAQGQDGGALSLTMESYKRNPLLWQAGSILGRVKQRIVASKNAKTDGRGALHYFRENDLEAPLPSKALREIARHDQVELIAARRKNYGLLNKLFMKSTIGIPLHPELKPGNVPYVYPLILKDASTFDSLRNAGIPLFRWEELAPSTCDISRSYRSSLIQIPCHQNLSIRDLRLIEATALALSQHG